VLRGTAPSKNTPARRVGGTTSPQTDSNMEQVALRKRAHQDPSVRRVAFLLEYQGTAYAGSQLQANAPTVQGALERALGSLAGESIRVALAGRTDAGVHARGQVAAFSTSSRLPLDTFARGTNALLPLDISVRAVAEVPQTFDPRRHALTRLYRYTLHLGPQRPGLLRDFAWHLPVVPDLDVIAQAAHLLPGSHDFASFVQPSEARRRLTQRHVTRAELREKGELALLDIEANAFLTQMVRRIVGALVEVGSGKLTHARFASFLEDPQPGAARFVAPAHGLCLIHVRYETDPFA
jgi:tRNA pseudouridine38-40 synthase